VKPGIPEPKRGRARAPGVEQAARQVASSRKPSKSAKPRVEAYGTHVGWYRTRAEAERAAGKRPRKSKL
jgi:hypothetical protein